MANTYPTFTDGKASLQATASLQPSSSKVPALYARHVAADDGTTVQQAIDSLATLQGTVAGLSSLKLSVVDALPDTGEDGIIYLVPNGSSTDRNIYNEYVWVSGSSKYELLGTTEPDLTPYVKTADMNTAISTAVATKQDTLTAGDNITIKDGVISAAGSKLTFDDTPTENSTNPVTSGGIQTALSKKQDKLTFDSTPTADSSNPVTSGGVKSYVDSSTYTDTNTYLTDTADADTLTQDVFGTTAATTTGGCYFEAVDGTEYAFVITDSDGRTLLAFDKTTGEAWLGAGVPQQFKDYVAEQITAATSTSTSNS